MKMIPTAQIPKEQGYNITFDLLKQANDNPKKAALILPSQILSYKELDQLTWQTAQHLYNSGIKENNIVALTFNDQTLQILTTLALIRLGVPLVPIPKSATLTQRKKLLSAIGVTRTISDHTLHNTQGIQHVDINSRLITSQKSFSTSLLNELPLGTCLFAVGSGSTGNQKIIPQKHYQLHLRTATAFGNSYLTEARRILSMTNLEYIAGINRLLSTIHHGGTFSLYNPRISLQEFCNKHSIDFLFATVFHIESLLKNIRKSHRPALDSLSSIRLSGSSVSDDLRYRIKNTLNENLQIVYGANECGRISISNPPQVYSTSQTVGFPLNGVNVEIVNAKGVSVERGKPGIVRIKTSSMITAYLNDPDATSNAFKNGWFYPGDNGSLTKHGELIIYGRADDMMIFNGINIYPAEIEQALVQHPAIFDIAVTSVKHQTVQDIPICIYSVNKNHRLTPSQFNKHALELLGFKSPKLFIETNNIPRTERGKIDKEKLTKLLQSWQSNLKKGSIKKQH